MSLYFAYGSNLDAENWREFCARHSAQPESMRPVGPAMLPDVELVFNYRSVLRPGGALNIRQRKGQFVHGALFEVSEHGWDILDLKESVAAGCYRRITHTAITAGGKTVPVVTYQVTRQRTEGFVPPSDVYTRIVRRGLAAFGLPEHQYEKAATDEIAHKEVDGVFVYGTLMTGESRHSAIVRHEPHELHPAHAPGRLHETSEDYPTLDVHHDDADACVRGEFVQFSDTAQVLEALDHVEEFRGYGLHRQEYVRSLLEVDAGRGSRRLAWTYVTGDRSLLGRHIESGCWRSHRAAARGDGEASAPA